jgi:photosystem II stability/assembly factor-like uncharacterized protein
MHQKRGAGMGALALAAAGLVVLGGCSQRGADAALAQERLKPVQRADQFQAAASNGSLSVVVGGPVVVAGAAGASPGKRIVLPGTAALIDVASCPDGSFVALDFYRKVWTADARAERWTPRALEGNWRPLALTCDSRNAIWVVGSGTTIAASTDKGASWSRRDFKEDAMFNTVQFVDGANGFITGEFGALYRTTDGGATWSAAPPIPNDFYPYAALFVSPLEGYVAGLAGAMLRTRDGGASWDKLENPAALPQFGLARHDGAIWSVGQGGSLQRLDGGRWIAVDYGPPAPAFLRALAPAGARHLVIAGAGGALKVVATGAAANAANAKQNKEPS